MKIKLLFLSLLISYIGYSQTISVSGNITTNTTWAVDTVKVTGDVTVYNSATLTIGAGTYVEFHGYYGITVYGRMIALGNVNDTIVFTIKDTTGYSSSVSSAGGWNSININSPSVTDSSNFEYCKFSYSTVCAITRYVASMRVEHCLFINNYSGAYFQSPGRPIIRSNTFIRNHYAIELYFGCAALVSDNNILLNTIGIVAGNQTSSDIINNNISYSGNGISIHSTGAGTNINNNLLTYNKTAILVAFDTNAVIQNNTIEHNSAIYSCSGISIGNSFSTIIGNTIAYNTSQGATGIFISAHSAPKIISNKLTNNYGVHSGCGYSDAGAILSIQSSPVIINNMICNNETAGMGGGISINDSSSALIINNTIANNKANYTYGGGGINLWGYSYAYSKNNIVWGNQAPSASKQIFASNSVHFDIDYCNFSDTINTPTLPFHYATNYQNLLMSDPLFVSPSAGAGNAFDGLAADWSLQPNSPCINAGSPDTTYFHFYPTDITGTSRVLSNRIDIGAYEYNSSLGISEVNDFINNSILVFPNPANENITIIIKETKGKKLQLKITDVLGRIVYSENAESASAIFNKTIDIAALAKGIYSITINDNEGGVYSQKLVKE